MTWVILTIAAAFLWSVINVVNKFLVEKHIKEPMVFLVAFGLLGILILLAIPFIDFSIPSSMLLLLIFVTGGIYMYAVFPYFIVLRYEEVSRVIALWQLSPIFVFFISFAILGETLTYMQAIAFSLLVFGGMLVAIKFSNGKMHWSKAVWWMLLSTLLFAVYSVLLKYIFSETNLWNGIVWIRISMFVHALVLLCFPSVRKKIKQFLSSPAKIKATLIGSEAVSIVGSILYAVAISLVAVALVEALLSFQPVFVFVFSIILSVKFKNIIEEKMDFKNMLAKSLGIVLVVAGMLFLYF
ncbi:DMT family transporter [Patescibacteria group bacterium]|nr:DMT family transporter [Patescibacteria group bacterium]